jgi:hypothetical protein
MDLQPEASIRPGPVASTSDLNHQPVQAFNPPQVPTPSVTLPSQGAPRQPFQADPDYDPLATYPGLDEPMSPNTAAIWMALIQYTEPDAHMAQTSGQAMLEQYEEHHHQSSQVNTGGHPGYGMLGTGVALASPDQSGQVSS